LQDGTRSAVVRADIVHQFLGGKMRTTHSRLGALASLILAVFVTMAGSASAQTPTSEAELGRFSAESKSAVRMQLCFGGAVAGFAALLLLRRQARSEW